MSHAQHDQQSVSSTFPDHGEVECVTVRSVPSSFTRVQGQRVCIGEWSLPTWMQVT